MFTHKLKQLPKNSVEILLDIPAPSIKSEYGKTFEEIRQGLTVEGFRKGKAPQEVAEKHIKKDEVYELLLRNLLSRIYEEILKKEGLKPVISPKIEVLKAKEGEDWQVRITVAQRPTVELGDYKAKLKALTTDKKKEDIWVPGKDKGSASVEASADKQEQKQKQLNDVLSTLLKEVKCEVPDLIVEDELNRKLSQLADDVVRLGLTVETYLKSKNLTMEQLRTQYTREIEETYKLEFILMEIGEKENIQVEPQELEKLFAGIPNPAERKQAEANAYFYASILRKQKTLDFLTNLR